MITNLWIDALSKKLPRGPRIGAHAKLLAHIDPAKPRRLDDLQWPIVTAANMKREYASKPSESMPALCQNA